MMLIRARRNAALLVSGAVIFSALSVTSASAELIERDSYAFSYGPEISFCGEPFQQEGVVVGRYHIVSRGPDGTARRRSMSATQTRGRTQ
jgi:hypothetical protein